MTEPVLRGDLRREETPRADMIVLNFSEKKGFACRVL